MWKYIVFLFLVVFIDLFLFYTQAGTEDGYVCLFNVNENRVLYDKSLAKQEGTCYNAIMLN